jgi:hypothetical protein
MKSKMVATAGLSLTLDPMGKMFQNAKVDRNSKMTTTAGHSFYIGPIKLCRGLSSVVWIESDL